MQRAAKSGSAFHMNEALNGISLSTAVHNGSQGAYDGKIFAKLNSFINLNPNATPTQCYNELMDIISDAKQAIINNPNVHLNNLNF
ncbi:hypothetical protein [Flavobacterium soli]|uniref:hypothetical protein n=1 Tax=Flavobacterium soli TaxID=344881 RepID=UPI00040B3276|nr:hypothetical protein [Flavobacterium soli]